MTVVQSFKEYVEAEIPKFDPRWLTEQFHIHDQDQNTLEIIYENLTSKAKLKDRAAQNFDMFDQSRDGRISQLPDDSLMQSSMSQRNSTLRMRRLINNGEEFGEINANDNDSEIIDQETMETNNFYRGWIDDINEVLLKAWKG